MRVWPSAAVTTQLTVFSPICRSLLPFTVTVAPSSLASALTAILVTSGPTLALYSVTSAENSGVRVPGEIFKDLSPASAEAPASALTVTAELPMRSTVAICSSASYTSWVLTVIWVLRA